MGLFSKKPKVDPAEVISMQEAIAELQSRLMGSEQARQTLEHRLHNMDISTTAALADRDQFLDDVLRRMGELDVVKRQVAQIDVVNAKIASLDNLNGRMSELNDRVSSTAFDANAAREQAALLSERVSSVSTELANQLGELGKEIDNLAEQQRQQIERATAAAEPTPAEFSSEVLDQLRAAQTRLAAEQARYEIAFRQDLASLADRVMHRPGSSH
jgi:hypothetical protein